MMDMDLFKLVQRAMTVTRGLEQLCCEDKLRDLGLFSLEKALGTHWGLFQYINGLHKKDGEVFLAGPVQKDKG